MLQQAEQACPILASYCFWRGVNDQLELKLITGLLKQRGGVSIQQPLAVKTAACAGANKYCHPTRPCCLNKNMKLKNEHSRYVK